MNAENQYVQPIYREVPPWVGKSLYERMADPKLKAHVLIQFKDPLKGQSSTSQNEIELLIALACCYMTAEDTVRICKKDKDLNDLEKDAAKLLAEVTVIKDRIRSKMSMKDSNIRDIDRKTGVLGAKWNNNGISMAAMHIFCSGILETQIDRIENATKHQGRKKDLIFLKERFDGMWYLINSWFPHESAEDDSVEIFNDFNMCMGA